MNFKYMIKKKNYFFSWFFLKKIIFLLKNLWSFSIKKVMIWSGFAMVIEICWKVLIGFLLCKFMFNFCILNMNLKNKKLVMMLYSVVHLTSFLIMSFGLVNGLGSIIMWLFLLFFFYSIITKYYLKEVLNNIETQMYILMFYIYLFVYYPLKIFNIMNDIQFLTIMIFMLCQFGMLYKLSSTKMKNIFMIFLFLVLLFLTWEGLTFTKLLFYSSVGLMYLMESLPRSVKSNSLMEIFFNDNSIIEYHYNHEFWLYDQFSALTALNVMIFFMFKTVFNKEWLGLLANPNFFVAWFMIFSFIMFFLMMSIMIMNFCNPKASVKLVQNCFSCLFGVGSVSTSVLLFHTHCTTPGLTPFPIPQSYTYQDSVLGYSYKTSSEGIWGQMYTTVLHSPPMVNSQGWVDEKACHQVLAKYGEITYKSIGNDMIPLFNPYKVENIGEFVADKTKN